MISSIGAANCIIVLTPKLDTIALNTQTTVTTNSYFNFPYVIFSKNWAVAEVCVFSAVVSNFGVSTIIQFAAPILDIIYPATMVLVIMTLFGTKIKNDNAFKGATYTALLVSILTVANNMDIVNISFINELPFSTLGFNWIVPVLIGGIIGNLIPSHSQRKKGLQIKNDRIM